MGEELKLIEEHLSCLKNNFVGVEKSIDKLNVMLYEQMLETNKNLKEISGVLELLKK